jgi:hypothetical protein
MVLVGAAIWLIVLNAEQHSSIVAVLDVPLVDGLQALHINVSIYTAVLHTHGRRVCTRGENVSNQDSPKTHP